MKKSHFQPLQLVKRTDDSIIMENHIVRFGGRDLYGEYFTPNTELESNHTKLGKIPIDWEHGHMPEDGAGRNDLLGYTDWTTAKADDDGVRVQHILDRHNEYIQFLDENGLLEKSILGTSSEADPFSAVIDYSSGEILRWPIMRNALTVTPAEPRLAGSLEVLQKCAPVKAILDARQKVATEASDDVVISVPKGTNFTFVTTDTLPEPEPQQDKTMPNEPQGTPAPALSLEDIKAVVGEAVAPINARMTEFEKAVNDERDPGYSTPNIIVGAEPKAYDHIATSDLAVAGHMLAKAVHAGKARRSDVSPDLYASLAKRAGSNEVKDRYKGDYRNSQRSLMSVTGKQNAKADEIHYSTLQNGGDEWVPQLYSAELVDLARAAKPVLRLIPAMDWPGVGDIYNIPLVTGDVSVYKVAEANDETSGRPDVTVTSSKLTSNKSQVSLGKLGARAVFSEELREDSIVPIASALTRNITEAVADRWESALIDGDVTTSASSNINDIAGTPASTDWFLLANGMRHEFLVTTTANGVSLGRAVQVEDVLTLQGKMGDAGIYGQGNECFLLADPNVYRQLMQSPAVQQRDVFSPATLESGALTALYNIPLYQTWGMCRASADRKANTAGKVDVDTTTNNSTGTLIMINPRYFYHYVRRNMRLNFDFFAESDATQVVGLVRLGYTNVQTEAIAGAYNISL